MGEEPLSDYFLKFILFLAAMELEIVGVGKRSCCGAPLIFPRQKRSQRRSNERILFSWDAMVQLPGNVR